MSVVRPTSPAGRSEVPPVPLLKTRTPSSLAAHAHLHRRRGSSISAASGALLLLLQLALPVPAQTTGSVLGQVSDPSGAAVGAAPVKAENLETGFVRQTSTNEEGSYLIPSLPLGSYRLTIEAPGFKTFTQSGITLGVNQNARVDVQLELGAVSETVRVEAEALAADTQSSAVGETIDRARVRSLPLNGRNVLALAQLLPGVGTAENINIVNSNARTGPVVTVSGSRQGGNNIQLDGTSMVQLMYSRGVNLPNPDAIREFKVLTNTYSAEYGRAYGGVFLGVTQSGTNEIHGSLFEYLRNDNLNARNFFSERKPKLTQNQFGGSLGGPLVKNRLFLFGSYQGVRIREEGGQTTFFPPTEAELRGDFSASPEPIVDPDTGAPFPNNVIPAERLDPAGISFAEFYIPPANRADGRHVFFRPIPSDANQYIIKADYHLTSDDRLDVRYYWNQDESGGFAGGDAFRLAGTTKSSYTTPTINHTHIFGPGLLNEFHASFFRIDNQWASPEELNRPPSEFGIAVNPDGPNQSMAPRMNVQGRFNAAPVLGFEEPEQTWEWSDKMSWIKGNHSLKFGFEFRNLQHVTRAQFVSGSFVSDGTFTGDAMADFVLGRPISFTQLSVIEDISESEQYHAFVQDDLKITPRLTLNLGLRYEVSTPWAQVQGRSGVFRVGQQSQRYPDAPTGLVFAGDAGVPPGLIPTDKNNVLPRLGFAYDLTGSGRTVIRGAYGVFSTPQAAIASAFTNETPPFTLTLEIPAPPSISNPYQGVANPFPYSFVQNPFFPDFPLTVSSFDPNFRDGYIQQYNLNVQRQWGDWLLQGGYVGSVGRKLSGLLNTNTARNGTAPDASPANIQERRPFPSFADIVDSQSIATSSYNAFQFSAKKRLAQRYTFQAAYTFSKSIDNRSGTTADDEGMAQDPLCFHACETGLSEFHQKHILALNGIWDLPALTGRGVFTHLFGGWQLSGQFRAGTGLPFTVVSGRDIALSGTGGQRPDVAGDGVIEGDRPTAERVDRFFNTAAFVLPARGRFGNSGRFSMVGPGFAQMDLSVNKRFVISESLGRVEFRAEFFNLLNGTNFNNPVSNLSSPAFGELTSAQDAREIQLALRYDF